MKIFETPNLSKEKKEQLEVEKILGRREIKKPGRLRRFLGEAIPGYENVVGKYWERMANYLEQEDVREAIAVGKTEAQIKKDVLKRKEAVEEKAVDKTTQSFRESIMEDAGVKEPEIIELTEEMVVDEPEIVELTEEMVVEDVGEKKLDEVKKDVKELAAKADKMFEELRKKYKGGKWDKTDEDYKEWLEITREVGILSKSLREKEKEAGDAEELVELTEEMVIEEKSEKQPEESVVVDEEYLKEAEDVGEKEKKAENAAEEEFMKAGEWMDKISKAIPKKKLEKLGIDVDAEAKTLVEIGKKEDELSFIAEDYFNALVENNNKKMEEYLDEIYEKGVKVARKKRHAEPEEPTKARASIRGER